MTGALRDFLREAGQVGRDLADVDWAATPLGEPETWPRSLQTIVRAMLASRFTMWMAWGPELTFFCNDAYRRDTLGKKYPWALGRPFYLVWPEVWPDVRARIESVLRTGEATWDERLMLFLERSGYVEETYHTFSYSPLTDDSGAIAGILCVVSEETERVLAGRQMATLRDLAAELTTVRDERTLFAAAASQLDRDQRSLPFTLAYLLDDNGFARLVSASGIAPGHPAAPVIIDPSQPDPAWPVNDVANGVAVLVGDLAERFADLPTGAWAQPPTSAYVTPLMQQGSGRPYGFFVAALNRYREFDDSYRGFVDLICGQLSSSIASARVYEAERERAEQLAELDRAKTAFFTNVSHEFRTPLTLILGPAEDLLADATLVGEGPLRDRLTLINRNAQRLLKLVNTLLDFSALESGSERGHFEATDLTELTTDLAETFRPAITRAGLELRTDIAPLPDAVHVDREMWAKIVLNLLSNALKFTFEGSITVRLGAEDGHVRLDVVDTGVGIDLAEQERLFERFHRITGARSRTIEGSGIGLALVSELAAAHGGEASVRSARGEGSAFTVRLPFGAAHLPSDQIVDGDLPSDGLAAAHQAQGFLAEAARWTGRQSASAIGADGSDVQPKTRPRVLVADDNADMRDYVASLLNAAYEVEVAADGKEALAAARRNRPDLVLTDVMMPNLDGLGLLTALRADPETVDVPVVMLSARAGEDGAVEGLEAGADDYLVKPFGARELLARVRANVELDRVRRTRAELERSRGLLDQAQRLAHVGSWEIDLETSAVRASDEYYRLLGTTEEEFAAEGVDFALRVVHPDDVDAVKSAIVSLRAGESLDQEFRFYRSDGELRIGRALGELHPDDDGSPRFLRGSLQDITAQREAERALATAAAGREALAREHRIADELQRSLLPARDFDPDDLDVATYYRAGVEGTQVGGDWFDVIELGAGRTALVMGDVMGRGVSAAAVMGQLRTAIRAYARLDLPPADLLESCDGVVRELGTDQIVTCVYGIYDPADHTFTYANAGHLPPLVARPGGEVDQLTAVAGPPLGAGPLNLVEETASLAPGSHVVLYTDGLVEHRDGDLDDGIRRLAAAATMTSEDLDSLPATLAAAMLPDGPDDDVAVLIARVPSVAEPTLAVVEKLAADEGSISRTRRFVGGVLFDWQVSSALSADIVLTVSELVTNAVLYGRAPIELRLRRTATHVVVEVCDGTSVLPRRLRPTAEDEHGRGLQLVSVLADRWGTRPTQQGKAVWCVFSATRAPGPYAD